MFQKIDKSFIIEIVFSIKTTREKNIDLFYEKINNIESLKHTCRKLNKERESQEDFNEISKNLILKNKWINFENLKNKSKLNLNSIENREIPVENKKKRPNTTKIDGIMEIDYNSVEINNKESTSVNFENIKNDFSSRQNIDNIITENDNNNINCTVS